MFELLLELGANINVKNNQGLTPLALAAKLARFEVILLFFIKN
jgi:ankyrin repeat protein